ncbi:MAG TPA: MATE family efflux transporter [Polyangiaceae bacterium]|nr:MATE family efflux transporter [Polyangiaceae bacterium]
MNLRWQHHPLRELTRLAWPIAISSVSYSVMTLVDTVLIGHVGRSELAGVGLGGITAFMLLCFSFGLLQGAKVLVSQAIGAGRRDQAEAYRGAAVTTAVAIGVVSLGLGQLVAPFIVRLASSEAAGHAARTYLSTRMFGAPMAMLYVALREVRYAEGDARSPMVATVMAQVTNIGLAVLFIFVLHKGVFGAACATVVAHTVEATVLCLGQRERGFGFRTMRREHFDGLLRVGMPTGLQFALEVGAFGTLSLLISLFSEVEMASHQIAIQVIHFSFLPAMAVAEAGSVLAGQAVGAAEYALVLRVARLAMIITGSYAVAWTIALAFGSRLIVHGFTNDPAVVATSVGLLHIAAVFQLFDAGQIVARCALRGSGDVRYAAVVGVVTSWLCTPTFAWLLGRHYGMGAVGGWLGLCLEIIVGTAILWWRLERGGWLPAARASRARLEAARSAEESIPEGVETGPISAA